MASNPELICEHVFITQKYPAPGREPKILCFDPTTGNTIWCDPEGVPPGNFESVRCASINAAEKRAKDLGLVEFGFKHKTQPVSPESVG